MSSPRAASRWTRVVTEINASQGDISPIVTSSRLSGGTVRNASHGAALPDRERYGDFVPARIKPSATREVPAGIGYRQPDYPAPAHRATRTSAAPMRTVARSYPDCGSGLFAHTRDPSSPTRPVPRWSRLRSTSGCARRRHDRSSHLLEDGYEVRTERLVDDSGRHRRTERPRRRLPE